MADERLVEALLAQVRASVGHEIEDEHVERVRRGIDDKLNQAEKLRQVQLRNGDEPYSVFRAYREGA
jgi:hypothetical protein